LVAQGGLPTGQAAEALRKPLAHVQASLGHRAQGPAPEGRCSGGRVARYEHAAAVSPAGRSYDAQSGRVRAAARATAGPSR